MQTSSKVYDSYSIAEAAVRDLKSTGVAAGEISLVAIKDLNADAFAAAGSAAVGMAGTVIDADPTEADDRSSFEAVRRSGALVTVRTNRTTDQIKPILERHGPIDASTRGYRQTTSTVFDPKTPARRRKAAVPGVAHRDII